MSDDHAIHRRWSPRVSRATEEDRISEQVVGAEKIESYADRLGGRRHVECKALLDLVDEVERVAALSVELVDKGDDRGTSRGRQTSKSLRACSSMPLAASSTITALSTGVRVGRRPR
jgi:hypothetical protein